ANLVLEEGGDRPGGWRELAAAVVSPPTAFNRNVFGERFKSIYPSGKPATTWQYWLGASVDQGSDRGRGEVARHGFATARFSLSYGLPGKPEYRYRRPLDYFDFDASVRGRGNNFLEKVTVRGLLAGAGYQTDACQGIWGLYGTYDYHSPFLFSVSS